MRCLRCSGSLQTEKHQHVEFNICSACRGIWVSGEQFHGLAVLVAAEGEVESSVKLTFQPRKALFNYAYDSNVFLDRCEQCKGIWLDPNEIIDIAKHIQYNPELDAIGKGLIYKCDLEKNGEEEPEWYNYLIPAAFVLNAEKTKLSFLKGDRPWEQH
ncbi:MAG: zf-TFIIB domain-containing protein [Planctomycetota bacterium]|jgi:Zn-finger nucleic acid-binding protein